MPNDQVNKYKSAAAGPKNVASQPSVRQIDNAKNTAIGRMGGTIKRKPATAAVRSDRGMSVSRSSSHLRPSKEGLMHAPSTLIAGNESGYANPSLQKARYKPKGMGIASPSPSFRAPSLPKNMITDYTNRGLAPKNSIKKLSSIMKKRLF